MRHRGSALSPVVAALVIVAVVGGIGTCSVVNCQGAYRDYSNGQRVGSVVKFSRRGLAFKSWEGCMMLNNMGTSGGAVQGMEWYFSVVDQTVIDQLQAALKAGSRVEVEYRQWFIKPVGVDTDYEVTAVKVLDK